MKAKLQKNSPATQVMTGLFSKQEAAQWISKGIAHVHSSNLGQKDPSYKVTESLIAGNRKATYSWESKNPKVLYLNSSSGRPELIQKIIEDTGLHARRELAENFASVFEELLTNAIYHAYQLEDGKPKYRRKDKISLHEKEKVCVRFAVHAEGTYLSVEDKGGRLSFENISRSFDRCYSSRHNQIEAKESGAGLGLYMVFETVTHLKIEREPDQGTIISCWIADKRHFDRDNFSFNFFERGR